MSNEGKRVSVHYVGTLDDGTKFDSSRDRGEPLEFVCMAGQMIAGFDVAVRDMEVGQTVNVRLEPEEAYGPRRDDMVITLPLAQLPGAENARVGMRVMLADPMGRPMPALVAAKDDTTITFDLNHEMAGKALNFEIELLEASESEEHCCGGRGRGCCHGEGRKHHEDGECCHGERHGDGECCQGEGCCHEDE
jgi:FKBP-type peptidyl-prolyl cis-trans isomerase 2